MSVDTLQHVASRLREAKRAGVSWPVAWRSAVSTLPTPRNDDELAERIALSATSSAWRRAYRGEAPTRGELLVAQLLSAITPEAAANAVEVGAITILR